MFHLKRTEYRVGAAGRFAEFHPAQSRATPRHHKSDEPERIMTTPIDDDVEKLSALGLELTAG